MDTLIKYTKILVLLVLIFMFFRNIVDFIFAITVIGIYVYFIYFRKKENYKTNLKKMFRKFAKTFLEKDTKPKHSKATEDQPQAEDAKFREVK